MDNKSYLQVPGREQFLEDVAEDSNDKYTAAIELSNKCREFYKSRLEAANVMKSKWREHSAQSRLGARESHDSRPHHSSSSLSSSSSSSSLSTPSLSQTSSSNDIHNSNNNNNCNGRKNKNSIDMAMERLRSEMVSLMDQDLSLMKQLLTLNETIEELKWQRQYYSCSTSCASLSVSKNLDSNWSVSETEMYDSEDDVKAAAHASSTATPTPGSHVTGPTWHSTRKARKASREFEKISLDAAGISIECTDHSGPNDGLDKSYSKGQDMQRTLSLSDDFLGMTGPLIIHDRDQNSFDSGIHEDVAGVDGLEWNV